MAPALALRPDTRRADASVLQLCAERGVRLTAKRRAVLSVFDETDEAIDAEEVLSRLRTKKADVSRASVYRTLHDMRAAGVIVNLAMRGRRELLQKRRQAHALRLLDASSQSVRLVDDADLVAKIAAFAAAHGLRLTGRIDIHVAPREAEPR